MDILNIAGKIHSISSLNVVTTTNEILDEQAGEKQSSLNKKLHEVLPFDGFVDSVTISDVYLETIDGVKFCTDNNHYCFVAYKNNDNVYCYSDWEGKDLYNIVENQIAHALKNKLYLYNSQCYMAVFESTNNRYELKPITADMSAITTLIAGKLDKLITDEQNGKISIDSSNNISVVKMLYYSDLTVDELLVNPLASATITKLNDIRSYFINTSDEILLLKIDANNSIVVPAVITAIGASFSFYVYYNNKYVCVVYNNSQYAVTQADLASIVQLTQSQYNATNPKDPNILYIITDAT